MADNQNSPLIETTSSQDQNRINIMPPASEDATSLLVPPVVEDEDLQIDQETLTDEAISQLKIEDLVQAGDKEVVIILKADPSAPFSSKNVWDVLTSLGLEWGDMDVFHWNNTIGIGDDYHFDVWSLDDPGYFIPENMVKDDYQLSTLMFGFVIPRTYKPTDVFNSMNKAIEYVQKRLGGTIVDRDENPVDYSAITKEISDVESVMSLHNLKPGVGTAMVIF